MPHPVNMVVYSDYICPWCYVAAARLKRLKEEYGDKVSIIWKSFLLIPRGRPPTFSLTNYIAHTNQSRARANEEEPDLNYKLLSPDTKLPSSSVPAHEAAKCTVLQGEAAFGRYHWALLQANFSQLRDISSRDVLISLAKEVGLDVNRFTADLDSGALREKVMAEYEQAVKESRFQGIPTVILDDKAVLEAAVPIQVYRQAVGRLLSARTKA